MYRGQYVFSKGCKVANAEFFIIYPLAWQTGKNEYG
jgi:hypothetical protein